MPNPNTVFHAGELISSEAHSIARAQETNSAMTDAQTLHLINELEIKLYNKKVKL